MRGVIELPGRQFGQSQVNECESHGQVEPWISSPSYRTGTYRDRLFVTTARERGPRRYQTLLDRTGRDAWGLGGCLVYQTFNISRRQLRQRGRVGDEVVFTGCENGLQGMLHRVGIPGMSPDGRNKVPCSSIVNPKLFGRQTQPISALEIRGGQVSKFLQQQLAIRDLLPVVHQVGELSHVGRSQDKEGLEDLPPNHRVDGVGEDTTQDGRLLHTERDMLE